MTRRNKYFIFLIAALTSLIWVACNKERDPCLQPITVPLRIGTYTIAEGDTGFFAKDSLLPNVIIFAQDSPSAFMYAHKNISKFDKVVLSPITDSTTIVFIADSAKQAGPFGKDTITFFYRRELHFISNACGYTTYYYLDRTRTTYNSIDSIRIFNGAVTQDAAIEHVKIYY